MDGETNGGQEATQGAQDASQQQGQEQQETQQQGQPQVGGNETDYERQIAERDDKIASLEAQVAEAAKNAETAEQLRGEIAELKAQGESDRIDFRLQLAGVRNVKAARALLTDHDNDVDKLKEAGEVARADATAARDIAALESLISDLKEYRQELAARYAQLETMAYTDRLELERRPDGWRGGNITYYLRIVRKYEDGTEAQQMHETFPGKQRRDALKRFEELKKQRPGIKAVKDIEKRSWER